MNIHKNARTTPRSRAMLVHRVLREHWPVSAVAIAFGVSERTVYKWLARYRAEGVAGLHDRRSVAHRRPHALGPAWLVLIRLLRQAKLVAADIATRLPLARSTVSAALSRLGLGRLRYLDPPPPVQRYEWGRPGELVHLDTKKLGRIVRPSHRVTGDRRDHVRRSGWEYAHVAIDDCSRFTYVEILPDEKRYTATRFWLRAIREFRRRGIRVERVLTDNGNAYRSSLPLARYPSQTDSTLSPADQRQSRAHDSNPAASGPTPYPTPTPPNGAALSPLGCAFTMRNDPG